MTTTIAKLSTIAELRETDRRAVENDLESVESQLAKEFGQLAGNRLLVTGGAGLLGDYFVDSNITLRDGKFRRGTPRHRARTTGGHQSPGTPR